MDIHLHIKKQHLYLFLGIITILAAGLIAIAQSTGGDVDPNKPWHPLQQVTKSATNTGSVDANGNGIIDMAESVAGLTGKCEFMGNGTTKTGKEAKVIDVPTSCKNQVCLLIVQSVKADTQSSDTLTTGVISKMNMIFYNQIDGDADDATSVHHWEAIGSQNKEGNNGDANEKVISDIKDGSGNVLVEFFDDMNSKENGPDQWTLKDYSNKYGVRLFACSI